MGQTPHEKCANKAFFFTPYSPQNEKEASIEAPFPVKGMNAIIGIYEQGTRR